MPATARLKTRKAKGHTGGRFHDILETAHLLSLSTVPEKVVETVLAHLCERLGKRSRCVLLEGDDLRLTFLGGRAQLSP